MIRLLSRALIVVAFLIGAASEAMAQFPSPTFDNVTVLGTASMQGGMNVSAPYTAPGMTATVKVERSSSSGFPSTWTAYDALNNPLVACATSVTACFQTAVNTAFPYALGTTAYGYDLEILGGDDPANGGGHNFGGAATVAQLTAPLQFPPIQGGRINIGAITLSGTTNDTVILDSCEMCRFTATGQLVYHNNGGTSYAFHLKPTLGTPFDNNFNVSPAIIDLNSVVGRVRFDLSGSTSDISNVDFHVSELNGGGLNGCLYQSDSPTAGENIGQNRIKIDQLHSFGATATAACLGTTTGSAGQLFGSDVYDVVINNDLASASANGVDVWESGSIFYLRFSGFAASSGYSLKLESGACKNTIFVTSDQASPTITDSSGCTGVNANAIRVNGGTLIIAGVAQQTIPQTLTAHGVLVGEGASPPTVATIGTGGRALVDQGSGADPQFKAITGDVALAASGASTVGNLSNVTNASLGTSAIAAAAVTNAKLANPAATIASVTCTLGSSCALAASCSALTANVAMNVSNTFFDGPSLNVGTSGTFWVVATVSVIDTAATGTFQAKLWDGTAAAANALDGITGTANTPVPITLAAIMTNPAGNLRVSVRNPGDATSSIQANAFGSSNVTSQVCALRLQ